jgi:hypothetical protein
MKRNKIPIHLRENLRYQIKAKDDPSLEIAAPTVHFQNQGNTYVKINNHWILRPLEFKAFVATPGKFITHSFIIEFIPVANPRAVEAGIVYSGNRLLVETIEAEKI